MRSYSNPNLTKVMFVEEVKHHQAADQYVKRTYWDNVRNRGCAIGCAVESINRYLKTDYKHDNHQAISHVLGIPVELLYLQDAIFEGLPDEMSLEWPLRFAEAISVGADTSTVWPHFAAWILRSIVIPAIPSSLCLALIEKVACGVETNWKHYSRDNARHDIKLEYECNDFFYTRDALMVVNWVIDNELDTSSLVIQTAVCVSEIQRYDKKRFEANWIKAADQLIIMLKEV